MAPRAMRMPTLAAVLPNPSENDFKTVVRFSPATTPTVSAPKIKERNGCSFTMVISTTITAMPARKARTS